MKKVFFALCLALPLSTAVFAQSPEPGDGSCFVVGIREPNTNIYNGPTFCNEINLSYLTVRGPLQLDKTKVTGKTTVHGPLKANGANLDNVFIANDFTAETVTLQEGSKVNGDITFMGRAGVVYLEKNAVVKGRVINGKIVNQ